MTAVGAAPQRAEGLRRLPHARWVSVGHAQNAAFTRCLRGLGPDDWSRPTDCSRWTVKDVAAHVLGAAEGFSSLRELRRQLARARSRRSELGNQLNAINEVQVEERRGLTAAELLARLDDALPRFVAVRRRVGGVGRFVPLYDPSVLGLSNFGYLFDTVFARDVFMHRVDVARATERPFEPTAEDRDLVADVVRDWARRAKPDVRLDLTGPLGGSFVAGSGAATVTGDAVELCRLLSGRGSTGAFAIEGDAAGARRALAAGVPF